METYEIIQLVEHLGCELLVEEEQIRVKQGKRLPPSLLSKIKEHKAKILDILNQDKRARSADFMIGLPGKVYTKTVNKQSNVYIELIDGKWEVWRETYKTGNQQAINTKIIASGYTFNYVLMEAKKFFDYLEKRKEAEHK
jgi:hypothetical protein